MDHLADFAQQISSIIQQHVPQSAIPPWWFAAGVGLTAGVALCVLGAKLARWCIVVILAGLGIAGGVGADTYLGISPLACGLVGGIFGGGVGYFFHRLWVGLFSAAFLATAVIGIYSSQSVAPHLVEFDHAYQVTESATADFHVGPGYDQPNIDWRHFENYVSRFQTYLQEKSPNVQRYLTLWALAAGIGGFVLGALFSRLILIVFTSACGSVLVAGGVALLAQAGGLDIYQTLEQRPGISGLGVVMFFVVSVVLQVMLTRSGVEAPVKASKSDD